MDPSTRRILAASPEPAPTAPCYARDVHHKEGIERFFQSVERSLRSRRGKSGTRSPRVLPTRVELDEVLLDLVVAVYAGR